MRLGVYVQVPFCQTKCTYCNFHTGVFSSDLYDPYVDAVCREITDYPANAGGKGNRSASRVRWLTPYTLAVERPACWNQPASQKSLPRYANRFQRSLRKSRWKPIPKPSPRKRLPRGSTQASTASAWACNRLTMPNFAPQAACTAAKTFSTPTKILRAAGFCQSQLRPDCRLAPSDRAQLEGIRRAAITIRPEHVSIYMMEIDEGSRLGLEVLQGGARYSAKCCLRTMPWRISMRRLPRTGRGGIRALRNFQLGLCRAGSRHNLKYWRREPYFGFGAGAHSFNGSQRWANAHDPAEYANSVQRGRFPVRTELEVVTVRNRLWKKNYFSGCGSSLASI